jgi:hypothetical protein
MHSVPGCEVPRLDGGSCLGCEEILAHNYESATLSECRLPLSRRRGTQASAAASDAAITEEKRETGGWAPTRAPGFRGSGPVSTWSSPVAASASGEERPLANAARRDLSRARDLVSLCRCLKRSASWRAQDRPSLGAASRQLCVARKWLAIPLIQRPSKRSISRARARIPPSWTRTCSSPARSAGSPTSTGSIESCSVASTTSARSAAATALSMVPFGS